MVAYVEQNTAKSAHLLHRLYVLSCLVVNMTSCVEPFAFSRRTAPTTESLSANPRSKTCMVVAASCHMYCCGHNSLQMTRQLGAQYCNMTALPGVCPAMLEATLPGTQRRTSAPPQSPLQRSPLALPARRTCAAPCLPQALAAVLLEVYKYPKSCT